MSRKYIGKKRTYRLNDKTYLTFRTWCSDKGVNTSLAIRGAIRLLMKTATTEELLKNSDILRLAVQIVKRNGVD